MPIPSFEISDVPIRDLVDEGYLAEMLEVAKARIEARRHRLNLGR